MNTKNILIIGVSGGSGSGKTTLSQTIRGHYGRDNVTILYQDSYYKDQSASFDGDGGSVNFDHPDSIDFDLLKVHLKKLKNGEPIQVPQYDFATHSRLSEYKLIKPTKIILMDGTLILSQDFIRQCLDSCIFLDIEDSLRYARRLKRDTQERGRTPEGVQRQYDSQVRPMYLKFVEPNKSHAEFIYKDNDCDDDVLKKLKLKFDI